MSRVLLVHGIGQQYGGPQSLRAACGPALLDGVSLAGGELTADDVSVAFYGDLFRPPGSRALALPDYDASDIDNLVELALLRTWWEEAARIDPAVPDPAALTRARTPRWTQRALYALSRSRFFGGMADSALIGSLKQVRAYLTDPAVRVRVQARVRDSMTPETRVLVGHSLGSVIGYEVLCGSPAASVTALVTLGSPLGIPNLIFDRLIPPPDNGRGIWPAPIHRWTNIADRGDVVALAKQLAPQFGERVTDVLVDNGARAHDVRPYLTSRETGIAIIGSAA